MKLFFCGGLAGEWMSGWQRCQCLKDLGYAVAQFDQERYLFRASLRRPLRVVTGRFYHPDVVDEFNRDFLEAVCDVQPDVAWVCFQDDNPFGSRPEEQKRWEIFVAAIPRYHLHFVKRESDLVEFKHRHAKSVRLFRHGFYTALFRPLPPEKVSPGLRQEVTFVGTPLDRRVSAISDLLVRHKIPLRIYGNRWHRTVVYHRRKNCFRPAVLGEDYVRVICGSKISLGFVSSSNRDEYTMRTFEIPACKGFFLAERTPAHQQLFVEGQEAEFFGSVEECADKIRFYLRADSERDRIAERGYRRCLQSDYSLRSSMAKAVAQIRSLGLRPLN